jgi:hypothetical protein
VEDLKGIIYGRKKFYNIAPVLPMGQNRPKSLSLTSFLAGAVCSSLFCLAVNNTLNLIYNPKNISFSSVSVGSSQCERKVVITLTPKLECYEKFFFGTSNETSFSVLHDL